MDKVLVLSLEATGYNGAVVLHCQGRTVFRSDARALSSMISEVLPSARRMVVDLSAVTSLDNSALGELVLTNMWADAAGYALKFSNPTEPVRRLLEATNLAAVLDVHPTVESALDAMQQDQVPAA